MGMDRHMRPRGKGPQLRALLCCRGFTRSKVFQGVHASALVRSPARASSLPPFRSQSRISAFVYRRKILILPSWTTLVMEAVWNTEPLWSTNRSATLLAAYGGMFMSRNRRCSFWDAREEGSGAWATDSGAICT